MKSQEAKLRPGVRLGPYEIVAPLGAGGMGQVWRAHDSRLGRDVAVKVLPAEFASDPERLQRFEREARATAALSHPNILAVYDIGSREGAPFIVEELVEGESLRDRLRRSALPLEEAADLAAQIARGLAAAHEKHIVHRDLKPDNVIVTRDGVAKILDFGLAKFVTPAASPGDATLTHVPTGATELGAVLGTAAYMAPEQAKGQAVDERADVFAFGIVLYEMLSGKRPFVGGTANEIVAAILKDSPSPLPDEVPERLRAIVARCLEKLPEDRFASARELFVALRDGTSATLPPGPSPASARASGVVVTPQPGPGRRRALLAWLAAAALAVAAVTVLVIRGGWPGGGAEPALDPAKVMVAPFENLTGEKSLDALSRMATEAIGQGLVRIGDVELLTAERVAPTGAAAPTTEAWRVAARSRGAGTLVTGSCYLSGDTVELREWLTDTGSGKVVYALDPDSGPRADPRPVVDAAVERVKGAVACRLSPIRGSLARPPRYEAFREFEEGMAALAVDNETAARHFARVVELDPDCWMGQIRLAEALNYQGKPSEAAAVVERVKESQARLVPLELLYLRLLESLLESNPVEGLRVARQLHELAPNDLLMAWNAAYLASINNRPREALQQLGDVRTWDWTRVGRLAQGEWFLRVAAWSHHFLGEYGAELEVAELAVRLYPGSQRSREHQVRALAALGRLDELERAVETSLTVPEGLGSPGTTMLEAAEELRAHGRPADAVRMAERGAQWYASRLREDAKAPVNLGKQAELLWVAERWEEAGRAAAAWSAENPKSFRPRGLVGVIAAHRGDAATARTVEAELAVVDGSRVRGNALYLRACIAAQVGEKDRALELLREAFTRGLPFDPSIHRYVYLEPLHGYAPFEELIKPKG